MIYGHNPILLNCTYIKPDKKKGIEEHFEVIYKSEDGVVRRSIEPPDVDIYFVKPEFRNFNYNKPEERIERLEKRRVKFSNIKYEIANEIGESGRNYVKYCFENKDPKALDKLYAWPYSFKADFQAEFYYMQEWQEKYGTPESIKLTKSFMDIETDVIDNMIDMDNLQYSANCPVNAVSVVMEEQKECYLFILRPYKPSRMGYTEAEYSERYKLYEKQLADHEKLMADPKSFIDELHESFDATYGKLDYHLREYEKEIELIADIFRYINDRKPNFCGIWNMRFDIQYLIYRVMNLGYNPADIMCHSDFNNKRCYFKTDKSTFKIEKQFDYFYCSNYTQFICEMRLYASIRKSQHMLKSVKLNDIAERELKDRKVEYQEESNFRTFPYKDWRKFLKYNIKDTLLLMGIERKTNDMLTYYLRSYSNLTPYAKIFRETHLLRNVREMYFNRDGWVQGNNINIIGLDDNQIDLFEVIDDDEDEDEEEKVEIKESSFKGAINANPIWNDRVGVEIFNRLSNILFENCIDFDMGAFYPSIKIFSNMDPITLLYKASFVNDEFINGAKINRSLNTTYVEKDKNNNLRNNDITGEAINTYVSGNILTFGFNWLGMCDITELYDKCKKACKLNKE
jgi:hypothetical protein